MIMRCTDRHCHHDFLHIVLANLVALLCLFAVTSSPAQPSAPQLSSDSDIASAGYFRLSWKTDAERAELQEATHPSFAMARAYYKGPDRAVVVSGKPNGTWYYRIRAIDDGQPGPWSEPITVSVTHHNLSRALMFLSLGIVVFVATVLMIIRGKRPVE